MKLETTLRSKMVMAMLVVLSLMSFTFSSCTKTESNDGSKFIGTWNGSTSCSGAASSASSIIISAGSNNNTVTMPGYVGSGSCAKTITYNLNASGNAFTCNQTFTDNCGVSYNISISGALSGNTLTMSFAGSGGGTGTCVFTGTK